MNNILVLLSLIVSDRRLINHTMLAKDPEEANRVKQEAMSLFLRVKQNTDDLSLGKKALKMEAYCLLSLKRLHEALSLLEPEETFMYSTEPLLACAYQMVGNPLQAKQVLQEGIYKNVVSLLSLLQSYLEQ